ncbi:MAG TPA: ParB/RepB/Spo0J family partition protein [Chitinophagaceae bacterium]|nr:ParB/RepB/Spo0J family partition protein [Chitinophagaceae bacterium]
MMSNPHKKEALGKGIRSLLQHIDEDLNITSHALSERMAGPAINAERISLDQIEANPMQPRRDFDPESLQELSESIRVNDLIQPITVMQTSAGKYRLISGERRFRAARMAGIKDLPAYIRQGNDEQLLVWALLENLQREDLNAIEIALGFQRLMEEGQFTQIQVAERLKKDRSTVTNYLRLLKLPPDIQLALRSGLISMGHARVLAGIEFPDRQLLIFREIRQRQLSVRQTEELVSRSIKTSGKPMRKSGISPMYRQIEDKLASHFSTRVQLSRKSTGKGHILISFFSDEDFDRIYALIAP